MKGSCLFLGTGASLGVPMVGCSCPVCLSTHPKDERLRSSVLLKIDGKQILIDSSPDFREQALRIGLKSLDGVIWTHAHRDHISGIDDLRPLFFHRKEKLPCLLSKETYEELKLRYSYLLETDDKFAFSIIEGEGEIEFLGLPIRFFPYSQAGMPVMGFRFGSFAYVIDLKDYTDDLLRHLQGVETLIVSAVRYEPSALHLSWDEVITFAQQVGAKQTYFSHLSHYIGHEEGSKKLPPGFALAYDGLVIPLNR